MNRPSHQIADCHGKAALKPRAFQTLARGPLTRPRAKRLECARFSGAFRPAGDSQRFTAAVRDFGILKGSSQTRMTKLAIGQPRAFRHSDFLRHLTFVIPLEPASTNQPGHPVTCHHFPNQPRLQRPDARPGRRVFHLTRLPRSMSTPARA